MASAVDFEAVLLRTLQDDPGLSELVGNKVFALVIPQGPKLPCITFQRLGGMPANTLSGHSGLEEIDLRIDVWARRYGEAKAVANAEGIMITEGDLIEMISIIANLDPNGMPSMAQDRINRKRTEVALFAGTIIERAERHGLLVPQNRWLLERVHEIESSW